MDSTVIGEDMEMQVVVVTHNVLPIRSLRRQDIPSSLPVKSKVYSCGRVRHKRGQQNRSPTSINSHSPLSTLFLFDSPRPLSSTPLIVYFPGHPRGDGFTPKSGKDDQIIQGFLNEKCR